MSSEEEGGGSGGGTIFTEDKECTHRFGLLTEHKAHVIRTICARCGREMARVEDKVYPDHVVSFSEDEIEELV